MTWLDLVHATDGLRMLFPDGEPSLRSVRIHEVILQQNAATVVLRLDLEEYPSSPPKKWTAAGHNTVQIALALCDARSLVIQGWGVDNVGQLQVLKSEELVQVSFHSQAMRLEGTFCAALLQKISAYCKASTP